jgi:Type I restriction-modification system methyltransferase subunit
MFLDSPLKVRLPKPFKEGITDLCSAGILMAISMLSENGLAVVTVMSSFLFLHSGPERRVRDYLLENRLIKGIISLPTSMRSSTLINTSILLLSKEKNESIFMVDLSSEKAEIYSYYDRDEHVRHINYDGLRIISDAAKGSGFERFVSFLIDYKAIDPEENIILPSRYSEKEEKPVRAIGEIDSEIADCFRALAALMDEFVTNLGR